MSGAVISVAWYRLRGTFGRRWGGYLSIVVLVGLLGGLAMGAVAGARRTQSSYPVLLTSTNPSDIDVATAVDNPAIGNGEGYNATIARDREAASCEGGGQRPRP